MGEGGRYHDRWGREGDIMIHGGREGDIMIHGGREGDIMIHWGREGDIMIHGGFSIEIKRILPCCSPTCIMISP